MKILMVGLGSIGQRHLRNIKKVCGESAEILAYRVRGLSRTFSNTMQIRDGVVLEDEYNVKSFSDLDEALLQKPEVAFITNITKSHIPCAIKAAKAGCHLFLEKPISDSLDGVDELEKIAKEKGFKIFVGFQNRYNPVIQYLKNFLQSEKIGKIISAHSVVGERLSTMHSYENYKDTYMARSDMGGGLVLNQMIHEIDYIRYLFGNPKSIYSQGGNGEPLGIDVEDYCNAIFEYDSFSVSVHADFYQFPPERYVQVIGTNGKITANLLECSITKTICDKTEIIHFEGFERNDMFVQELKDFLECVEKKSAPKISLNDGIASLKIALDVKKSIIDGGKKYEFAF